MKVWGDASYFKLWVRLICYENILNMHTPTPTRAHLHEWHQDLGLGYAFQERLDPRYLISTLTCRELSGARQQSSAPRSEDNLRHSSDVRSLVPSNRHAMQNYTMALDGVLTPEDSIIDSMILNTQVFCQTRENFADGIHLTRREPNGSRNCLISRSGGFPRKGLYLGKYSLDLLEVRRGRELGSFVLMA